MIQLHVLTPEQESRDSFFPSHLCKNVAYVGSVTRERWNCYQLVDFSIMLILFFGGLCSVLPGLSVRSSSLSQVPVLRRRPKMLFLLRLA